MKISSIYKYSASAALVSLFLISNYANAQNTPQETPPAAPATQNQQAPVANSNAPKAQGQMRQGMQERKDQMMEKRQERKDHMMEKRQEHRDEKMKQMQGKRDQAMEKRQEGKDGKAGY